MRALTLSQLPAEYRDGCTGPFYGNEYDGAPCDDPACPVCPASKAAVMIERAAARKTRHAYTPPRDVSTQCTSCGLAMSDDIHKLSVASVSSRESEEKR